MRTLIHVQMHNVAETVKIAADEVEEGKEMLIFKVGGKKVGEFSKLAIAGWWILQGDELRG